MDFIGNKDFRIAGPVALHNGPSVFAVVPVEIGGVGKMVGDQFPGQRGLTALAGAGDKNHFLGKILHHKLFQISLFKHGNVYNRFRDKK